MTGMKRHQHAAHRESDSIYPQSHCMLFLTFMSRTFLWLHISVKEKNFDIESKISALLRLSESTAIGTSNEAALALETAIRMAAKHGIKISDLADKRNEYVTNTWFHGQAHTSQTTTREYREPEWVSVKRWCDTAEKHGWSRHRKTHDVKEGWIYAYRKDGQSPKLELRIFNRPWGDIEFEVIRNPDPIIGEYQAWMEQIFDVVALGVTYEDFYSWIQSPKISKPRPPGYLNTSA